MAGQQSRPLPIENIWFILKNHIEKENVHGREEFLQQITKSWEAIDVSIMGRLIDSVPQRLKYCRYHRGELVKLKYL